MKLLLWVTKLFFHSLSRDGRWFFFFFFSLGLFAWWCNTAGLSTRSPLIESRLVIGLYLEAVQQCAGNVIPVRNAWPREEPTVSLGYFLPPFIVSLGGSAAVNPPRRLLCGVFFCSLLKDHESPDEVYNWWEHWSIRFQLFWSMKLLWKLCRFPHLAKLMWAYLTFHKWLFFPVTIMSSEWLNIFSPSVSVRRLLSELRKRS